MIEKHVFLSEIVLKNEQRTLVKQKLRKQSHVVEKQTRIYSIYLRTIVVKFSSVSQDQKTKDVTLRVEKGFP